MISQEIKEIVATKAEQLWDIAHAIHGLHELKFEEVESASLLTYWLEEQGFEVNREVAGMKTAFVAHRIVGHHGPTVAFVAEYDALPELGHACGHNVIATMSVGAGAALATWLEHHNRAGHVMVIGSPGEEGGGGKIFLLDQGAFAHVDIAMMLHPAAKDEVAPEYLAREGIDVDFFGVAAHAAAAPEKGINALDAVVMFYQMLHALRPRFRPSDRIHGIITHGGDSPNVIPEHTSARILVRSKDADRVHDLLTWVEHAAEAAARGTGCQFRWSRFVPFYNNVRHNSSLVALADQVFREFDRMPVTMAEAHGSTDMGNVSHVLPSFHANIGLGDGLVTHTHGFCAAADSEAGRQAMIDGAGILATMGARYVSDLGLQQAVRENFDGMTQDN
ncbi:amidohydrolase [Sulfobacillus thermosulfidooxidans DSM 9293]|uniref:Peptidase M20 domain-containing protein 2 n=2 Tax=Sulfobacillus thermosulfidooxidans TaxID=28034 RepID=A0A1W1WHM1_SULTA|nr:amidohydrolase [Sulfobacillus thermosulfidooxidans DSM 9293]